MNSEQLREQLTQLGVSGEEASVYLALTVQGTGYVSVIAKRAGVQRVNCYHLLEGLRRKGLVSESLHKGAKKVYQANPPEVLVKQQLERLRVAELVLPQLHLLTKSSAPKVSIRPIEGAEGIRSVFDETLNCAGEILGYTNIEGIERVLKDYLHYYAEERINRRLKSRLISPLTKSSRGYLSKYYQRDPKKELTEIVYVDSTEFPFEGEVYIFADRVATFSLNQKQLIGVVIESAHFARTYRSIFNLSWLGATSFVAG